MLQVTALYSTPKWLGFICQEGKGFLLEKAENGLEWKEDLNPAGSKFISLSEEVVLCVYVQLSIADFSLYLMSDSMLSRHS